MVLPSASCSATPQKSRPKPQQTDIATPACSPFASLVLRVSQHRSARSKRTPRYRLCTIFGASVPFGIISQGIRTGIEPLRKEARLFGPALCQLLTNPAEEPTQASTNRHSHASLQSTCQLRALHMTRIASRTARACLGTASAPFFLCFRPARNYAQGQAYWNRDGIISGQDNTFCRFAEGPRTSC